MTPEQQRGGCDSGACRQSVYLLYWYNSTNTDTRGAGATAATKWEPAGGYEPKKDAAVTSAPAAAAKSGDDGKVKEEAAAAEAKKAEADKAEEEKKAAEMKAAEMKAAEMKAAEMKAAEMKAAEMKAAEAKAAELAREQVFQ